MFIQERGKELPVNKSESVNSWRIVAWILESVAKSMLLVASSNTIIELRPRRARAIAISCLWPCEKFVPPGDIFVSSVMELFESKSIVATDTASNASSWMSLEGGPGGVSRGHCVLLMFDVTLAHSPKSSVPDAGYSNIRHCRVRLEQIWDIAIAGENIVHTEKIKIISQSSWNNVPS